MDVFKALQDAGYPMEVARFPDGKLYWKVQSSDGSSVKVTTDDDRAEAFAQRVALPERAKKTKKTEKPTNSILGFCRSCCAEKGTKPRDRARCPNFRMYGTDCMGEGPDMDDEDIQEVMSYLGIPAEEEDEICILCDRHSCHLMGYCHECSIDMDDTKAAKPAEPDDEDGFTVVEKKSTRRMKKAIRGRPGKTGRRFH